MCSLFADTVLSSVNKGKLHRQVKPVPAFLPFTLDTESKEGI